MAEPARVISSASVKSTEDRLSFFGVSGLFGEFSYQIPLNVSERITAIIAPNGSGKTLCLRLINAFFSKRWSFFNEVKFDAVDFRFLSNFQVRIVKQETQTEGEEPSAVSLRFHIFTPDGESQIWTPDVTKLAASRFPIERYLPFITRRGPNRWTHDHTGEEYTLQSLIENYGEHLPDGLMKTLYSDAPPSLLHLIESTDCHLIETQRLLILKDESEDPRFRAGPGRSAANLAISKKAQTLRSIITRELTDYAALSQSLDRSFPQRVIQQQKFSPPDNLESKLKELDEKRRSLMDAGILDTEADEPVSLPEGPMEPAISRVLSVYAEDTSIKLSSLSTLLKRIQLFKELIKQRFSTKDVLVSKQTGFEVVFRGNKVPLEKLSSGEQHQLVLFFELLFELRQNALILIDEPELSLHVAWQKKFISDLKHIIGLNKFDVILATHSPQLISRWTNLVVELGQVDDQ